MNLNKAPLIIFLLIIRIYMKQIYIKSEVNKKTKMFLVLVLLLYSSITIIIIIIT